MPSFSRPRVSDDSPHVESRCRTLEYRPGYPRGPFASLDEAKAWVAVFVGWYDDDHQHSGIRFVTPSERHDGRDRRLLAHRHDLYQRARARQPSRWTGRTRDWSHVGIVRLNPEHGHAARAA